MSNNNQIIEELIHLKDVLLSNGVDMNFDKYSPIFTFTTENIGGYYDKLNINDSKMLVPCASGDHLFEAIINGAKSVDLFDINAYSYHMVMLKLAAIKTLNKNEYINFFLMKNISFNDNDDIFNKKVYYEKIRSELPQYSRNFWDNIYKMLKTGMNIKRSNLIINSNGNPDSIINLLNYLKDDNYEILKEKVIKNKDYVRNYYNCNVISLPDVLKDKYDIILLSNIQDYIHNTYNCDYNESIDKYRNFIKNSLSKFVTDEGIIVSEYYYYYKLLVKITKDKDFKDIEIPATYDILNNTEFGPTDLVRIYSKKRN